MPEHDGLTKQDRLKNVEACLRNVRALALDAINLMTEDRPFGLEFDDLALQIDAKIDAMEQALAEASYEFIG